MRFLREATQDMTTILCCRAAQVRAVRISSPNLASMNVRTLCPFAKVIVWTPFQSEGLTDPLRTDHAVPTVRSHCSQSLNQCASLPQLAELGLIGIAIVFPAPRYELSALEVRVAVAGVPPAFAQQSPSRCTSTCSDTTLQSARSYAAWCPTRQQRDRVCMKI